MQFTSLVFVIFLTLTFLIYWKLDLRKQNIFIFFASYVFYGWWDYRFLLLLFISTVVDFYAARQMMLYPDSPARKRYLYLSLAVNLGLLGFFKYFNFFIASAQDFLQGFGFSRASVWTLNIVLPVGISFYTFQTLSYTVDVYRRRIEASRSFVQFAAFVSFFPQLVAGPIERASHLLPQFGRPRNFDYPLAVDGLKMVLWGFFKKIVIADNLALVVNALYADSHSASGTALLLGTIFFAFQIYADFSAYSEIARGTARLFGFDIMRNFAYPYFSRNIVEFWRNWHISLSGWFRDYVFIPLGGSRVVSKTRYIFNIIVTFSLSGLWHGPNWTFVLWGFLNGIYYVPSIIFPNYFKKYQLGNDKDVARFRDVPKIILTFIFILLTWVFFRSTSVAQAWQILGKIFSSPFDASILTDLRYLGSLGLVAFLVTCEWLSRGREHPLEFGFIPRPARIAVYVAVLAAIFFIGQYEYIPFIYFQF